MLILGDALSIDVILVLESLLSIHFLQLFKLTQDSEILLLKQVIPSLILFLNPAFALKSANPKVNPSKFDNVANAEWVSTHISACLILLEDIILWWLAPQHSPHGVFEIHIVF